MELIWFVSEFSAVYWIESFFMYKNCFWIKLTQLRIYCFWLDSIQEQVLHIKNEQFNIL